MSLTDAVRAAPASGGREPAVEVTDLVKRYPKRPVNAVDGLSFCVAAGEVFGLLGPDGAGKTTTLGVLTTRVVPTSGTARVAGGVDRPLLGALARHHRAPVGDLGTAACFGVYAEVREPGQLAVGDPLRPAT